MSAVKGPFRDNAGTEAPRTKRPEPWEKTPWWHPYRWFGWDLQRSDGTSYDPDFEYGRSKKVAHEALRDLYATDVDLNDPAWSSHPNYIARLLSVVRKAKR